MGLMAQFSTGFSRDLRPNFVTAELATGVESVLGGPGGVGGGLLFATSASGNLAFEVGERLGNRWPDSGLTGSSFEGLLAKGQVFRDEPAFGLLAWAKGDVEPIPLFFDPAEVVAEQLAFDLFEAAGRSIFTEDDLLLLFPMRSHRSGWSRCSLTCCHDSELRRWRALRPLARQAGPVWPGPERSITRRRRSVCWCRAASSAAVRGFGVPGPAVLRVPGWRSAAVGSDGSTDSMVSRPSTGFVDSSASMKAPQSSPIWIDCSSG
jgi:hypothetical protein